MTAPKYNDFLKKWSTENKITSFFGSDKPDFLKAWNNAKSGGRILEAEQMGVEDINLAGEPFKKLKPLPIKKIIEEVSNLPPVSAGVKAFSKVLTSKQFDDMVEDGVKDLFYSQFPFPGMVSRDKLYQDKFLTLSTKKQNEIQKLVRAELTKQFIIQK